MDSLPRSSYALGSNKPKQARKILRLLATADLRSRPPSEMDREREENEEEMRKDNRACNGKTSSPPPSPTKQITRASPIPQPHTPFPRPHRQFGENRSNHHLLLPAAPSQAQLPSPAVQASRKQNEAAALDAVSAAARSGICSRART